MMTLTVERAEGGRSERNRRGVLACRAKGLNDVDTEVKCFVFILIGVRRLE